MLAFASSRNIYEKVTVYMQKHEQVYLKANLHQKGKRVLIYGTRVTQQMYARIIQLRPQVAFSCVKHHNLVRLVEKPFISVIPLHCKIPSRYFCLSFENKGQPLLQKLGKLSKIQVLSIMIQIVNCLQHLKKRFDLIHGEISSDKIYLQKSEQKDEKWVVKMIPPRCRAVRKTEQLYLANNFTYKSPEFLEEFQTDKTDIWSLGLLLYEMIQGKKLNTMEQYQNAQHLYEKVVDNNYSLLIKRMIQINFRERIKLSELKETLFQMKLVQIEGTEYFIPFLDKKDLFDSRQILEDLGQGTEEKRIVLNGFLLSLIYQQSKEILHFRLLFKRNLFQFMKVSYKYEDLPEKIKKKWSSLQHFIIQISKKKKNDLTFMTDGQLLIRCKNRSS